MARELKELEKEAELALIEALLQNNREMREALKMVSGVIENSEAWWINCPDAGGIDEDMVDHALTKSQAAQYLQTVEKGLIVDERV